MTLKKKSIGFACSLVLLFSCNAQDPKSNKEIMDELLKRELENQKQAKYGNKDPFLEVITDPAKVAKLKTHILKKTAQRDKENVAKTTNETPWVRYKKGDKSVVPQLLAILKSNNTAKRIEVYNGLEPGYDDRGRYAITEPGLIEQIFKGIENPTDEKAVIQLAGIARLKGYESRFEKRLLSGKSDDEGRLLYWLGQSGKSKVAFDHMDAAVRNKKMSKEDLDNAISSFADFGKNGDADIKKRTGALALFIYQQKLLDDSRYEELKSSAYTSDAAETVLTAIFDYDDKDVIPVAYDILNRGIRTYGPVKALIRLEGSKHMDKVYGYLKNEDDFYKGLDIIETLDRSLLTPELLKEVLLRLSTHKEVPDYVLARIVRFYKEKNALQYIQQPGNYISNKELANRLSSSYAVSAIAPEDVLKDLHTFNLIDKDPGKEIMNELVEESEGNAPALAYSLLDQQKRFFAFDTETSFVPVDYDKLLLEFAARSNGVLKDMLVWMDFKDKNKGENFDYTITVVFNNKAYIAKPEDVGDWYDMGTVQDILEKLFEDTGSKEKFVPVDTGDQTMQYIFGEPAKVKAFLEKYKYN